jgi:hypothetical protein
MLSLDIWISNVCSTRLILKNKKQDIYINKPNTYELTKDRRELLSYKQLYYYQSRMLHNIALTSVAFNMGRVYQGSHCC